MLRYLQIDYTLIIGKNQYFDVISAQVNVNASKNYQLVLNRCFTIYFCINF